MENKKKYTRYKVVVPLKTYPCFLNNMRLESVVLSSVFRAFARLFIFVPFFYLIYLLIGNGFSILKTGEILVTIKNHPHAAYYFLYPWAFPFLCVSIPAFFDLRIRQGKWMKFIDAGLRAMSGLLLIFLSVTIYQSNPFHAPAGEELIQLRKDFFPPLFPLGYSDDVTVGKIVLYSTFFNQLIEPLKNWLTLSATMLAVFLYQSFFHLYLSREPNSIIRTANGVSISFLIVMVVYTGVILRYVYL